MANKTAKPTKKTKEEIADVFEMMGLSDEAKRNYYRSVGNYHQPAQPGRIYFIRFSSGTR